MDEIRAGNLLALPQDPSFAAWAKAWSAACVGVECTGIGRFFFNSVKMVVPAVADLDADRRAERLRADQVDASRVPTSSSR